MTTKEFIPFGGVHGWLADLSVPKRLSLTATSTVCYYVAEADERRAMTAIRQHAGASNDATLVPRRALSRREVQRLGLKRGEVKAG